MNRISILHSLLRSERGERPSSPYTSGRRIHTSSASTPSPLRLLTRSKGFRTLSTLSTFFCRKAWISDSTRISPNPSLPAPELLPYVSRMLEMVGISNPVRGARHVSGLPLAPLPVVDGLMGISSEKMELLAFFLFEDDADAARTAGSTSRSGMEGCRIVRWEVKRSSRRRRTALRQQSEDRRKGES